MFNKVYIKLKLQVLVIAQAETYPDSKLKTCEQGIHSG